MAERLNSQHKAGGPLWAARNAQSMFAAPVFLWRAPTAANDNPAPLGKRLARLAKLMAIIAVIGGLGYAVLAL